MKIEIYSDTDKQSQMLKLLQFGTVMVFVDSRHPDVLVPGYLKGDYQLRLNFDYAYEISDFMVLPDRIEASLSFNRKDFFCVIPYEAVYLIVNHGIEHGALFVQSVPLEMLQYFAEAAEDMEENAKKREASHLSVISSGSTSTSTNSSPTTAKTARKSRKKENRDETPQKKSPPRRGHLKLVK